MLFIQENPECFRQDSRDNLILLTKEQGANTGRRRNFGTRGTTWGARVGATTEASCAIRRYLSNNIDATLGAWGGTILGAMMQEDLPNSQ